MRRQASLYIPDAINTLGAYSKGEDVNGVAPNANVVRSSARDIIEFAGGRPETRDPRTNDPTQQVQIFVQRFSDGTLIETTTGMTQDGMMDAIEARDKKLEQKRKDSIDVTPTVAKEYEVPDAEDQDPV